MRDDIAPRPELARVPSVPHGGFNSALAADDWLDFSSNVNPFGPSPLVWDAIRASPIDRHPDPRAWPLRRALAEHLDVDPARVLVGNGSVDLIYQIAVAFVRPGDRVLIVAPTFGEYAAATMMMGAEAITHQTCVEQGFQIDPTALIQDIRRYKPRLLFLCNPNNPTGVYADHAIVKQIVRASPATLVVLDEAYVRFVADAWDGRDLLGFANLLILRSLTKDYALTGLRAGYALASSDVIAALETVQPPWSVNAFAQAASLAALGDEAYLQATLIALARAATRLRRELESIGVSPLPSAVNFMLAPVPSAAAWSACLRSYGILVRDCTSFGLPTFIRIAARRPADNARLVAALAACKEQQCPDVR